MAMEERQLGGELKGFGSSAQRAKDLVVHTEAGKQIKRLGALRRKLFKLKAEQDDALLLGLPGIHGFYKENRGVQDHKPVFGKVKTVELGASHPHSVPALSESMHSPSTSNDNSLGSPQSNQGMPNHFGGPGGKWREDMDLHLQITSGSFLAFDVAAHPRPIVPVLRQSGSGNVMLGSISQHGEDVEAMIGDNKRSMEGRISNRVKLQLETRLGTRLTEAQRGGFQLPAGTDLACSQNNDLKCISCSHPSSDFRVTLLARAPAC